MITAREASGYMFRAGDRMLAIKERISLLIKVQALSGHNFCILYLDDRDIVESIEMRHILSRLQKNGFDVVMTYDDGIYQIEITWKTPEEEFAGEVY